MNEFLERYHYLGRVLGHEGTIYKASNWKFKGYSSGGNWLNRPNRKCNVGKHKKKKWEFIFE